MTFENPEKKACPCSGLDTARNSSKEAPAQKVELPALRRTITRAAGSAPTAVIASAKYVEKYRRTPEGWKISYMNAVTYFTVPFDKGWANPGGPEIQVPIPAGAEPA